MDKEDQIDNENPIVPAKQLPQQRSIVNSTLQVLAMPFSISGMILGGAATTCTGTLGLLTGFPCGLIGAAVGGGIGFIRGDAPVGTVVGGTFGLCTPVVLGGLVGATVDTLVRLPGDTIEYIGERYDDPDAVFPSVTRFNKSIKIINTHLNKA